MNKASAESETFGTATQAAVISFIPYSRWCGVALVAGSNAVQNVEAKKMGASCEAPKLLPPVVVTALSK
jgi:hypothetical protein